MEDVSQKHFKITTSCYVILFFCFGYSGHCFDCDINPSWNAVWWAKLGATGFSGLPPWVVELLVGWEALRVNRSWHENTDLVRCSEGRGRGYACCIYEEGQRPQKKESSGGFGEQTGAGKDQCRYPKAPWCGCKRVREVHVSSFPRQKQEGTMREYIILSISNNNTHGWAHGQMNYSHIQQAGKHILTSNLSTRSVAQSHKLWHATPSSGFAHARLSKTFKIKLASFNSRIMTYYDFWTIINAVKLSQFAQVWAQKLLG